ncbi:SDR family NAD(P)-dependent oxidoreductase [Streptomyces sp. NPDC044984]|uniref:SDR family NAD(P)-dependent oxidoreductase n=1 Tax=Streptomyces sp. NPDC044984 TaxID=3154335 RepID=UPI003400B69B
MHTLVMTGATRGIGHFAAAALLHDDPELRLVVLARESTSAEAMRELRAHDRVTVINTELASIDSIELAGRAVCALLDAGKLPPLRGFVGNAGVQFTDALHTTPDGLETTFAVNVLANHLLLRALESRLVGPARIVITNSGTHFGDLRHTYGLTPAPRWADPAVLARPSAFPSPATTAAGYTAYATSRLAAMYLVHEWARRLPCGVDIVAHSPGLVPATGHGRHAKPFARFLDRRVVPLLTLTPAVDNAATAGRRLAATVTGRTAAPSGSYVDRTRVTPSSNESYDVERERALWDYLEAVRLRNVNV